MDRTGISKRTSDSRAAALHTTGLHACDEQGQDGSYQHRNEFYASDAGSNTRRRNEFHASDAGSTTRQVHDRRRYGFPQGVAVHGMRTTALIFVPYLIAFVPMNKFVHSDALVRG